MVSVVLTLRVIVRVLGSMGVIVSASGIVSVWGIVSVTLVMHRFDFVEIPKDMLTHYFGLVFVNALLQYAQIVHLIILNCLGII